MGKDISKNKVFQSPYKDEVEKRLAMGQSPRSIANWLKTRGETISYATINEYKKNFFNVDAEVGKIIKDKQEETKQELKSTDNVDELEEKQKALLETERNRHIATVRSINHVAVLYNNIHDMTEYLSKLQNYEPVVAAHAAKGLYSEIRATIEVLEKLKDKEGTSDNSSVAKLLSAMRKEQALKKKEEENNGE
jgi:hypothetical protein